MPFAPDVDVAGRGNGLVVVAWLTAARSENGQGARNNNSYGDAASGR